MNSILQEKNTITIFHYNRLSLKPLGMSFSKLACKGMSKHEVNESQKSHKFL